jgi:hypothetical protein
LFVKSICTDLDSLSFIHHFLVQIATLLTADCSFLVEISTVSPIVMTVVSSTMIVNVDFARKLFHATKRLRHMKGML